MRWSLHAQVLCADAGRPQDWFATHCASQPFDAIVLDAPCTASGIVRRHPDVRWLRRPSDVAQLAAIQAQLLDALWPLLAPGGRCACSMPALPRVAKPPICWNAPARSSPSP